MGRGGAAAERASLECGFVAGLAVTALLHPWDRALYLSVINATPFFVAENWRQPYRGLSQTLVGRSFSSGIYFPLEDACGELLGSRCLGGQAAGVLSGAVLNPLSLIKYQSWGSKEGVSFAKTASQLYRDAGPSAFLRGALTTACRDAIFGLCFSLRGRFQTGTDHSRDFAVAMLCAAAGTTLSSPFNYLRNRLYAEGPRAELGSARARREFLRQALEELAAGARGQRTPAAGLQYVQGRLRLGWGTARVGVGMALADQVYTACGRLERAAAACSEGR